MAAEPRDVSESTTKGAKRWPENAPKPASVVTNVANPIADPLANRCDPASPPSKVDMSQRRWGYARHDWASYEEVRERALPMSCHPRPAPSDNEIAAGSSTSRGNRQARAQGV